MMQQRFIGFGIAGNIAGHLEQAGEAADFVAVQVNDAAAPKALFPFYVPNREGFLGQFPLNRDNLELTEAAISGDEKVQLEPEVALWCRIEYGANNEVIALHPERFAAYNDCSIRRPHAKKISEKKNWGANSKGLGNWLPLNGLQQGCELDGYRIACFLLRDDTLHPYGIDSPVLEYSYFHQKLLNWLLEKMNHQQDQGPAEDIRAQLALAEHPEYALISIGATRYTPFGAEEYLDLEDTGIVVLYPASRYSLEEVMDRAARLDFAEDMSALAQRVQRQANA